MTRIIYVNGRYLSRQEAVVPVEDRGYMFADGVYEGFELRDGKIIDTGRHLGRLKRSMSEISFSHPPKETTLRHILKEVVRRNRVKNGFAYLQITRGVAARDYRFPAPSTPLSITCLVYAYQQGRMDKLAAQGIRVLTRKDIRWSRPDIKSLQLLPGVLARQAANEAGALEAWLLDDQGNITEGAASNAWIINDRQELITRQTDQSILKGITRQGVLDVVKENDLTLIERAFSLEEAYGAKEAFITSASMTVMPVIEIDDRIISDGSPGKITLELRKLYGER